MNTTNTTSFWACTDPDCGQHRHQSSDFVFYFVEIRELPDERFAVVGAPVDLRDYTLDELWDICKPYYESYEQMVAAYGFRDTFAIAAECVFEQMRFDDMEVTREADDYDAATAALEALKQQIEKAFRSAAHI